MAELLSIGNHTLMKMMIIGTQSKMVLPMIPKYTDGTTTAATTTVVTIAPINTFIPIDIPVAAAGAAALENSHHS